jgi:hypothetical protein
MRDQSRKPFPDTNSLFFAAGFGLHPIVVAERTAGVARPPLLAAE